MKLVEAIEKKYRKDEPEYVPVERSTFTTEETATYLGVSRDLVYKLARQKRIPHFRIGNRVMFKKDSIDRWLSELEQEGYNAAE